MVTRAKRRNLQNELSASLGERDNLRNLSRAQAEQIAKTKTPDLTAADLEAAVRTVAGSARSMGVEVEGFKHG